MFDLIGRSIKISKLTGGAFDISFAGIEKLYRFDKKEYCLPNEDAIIESISRIDYKQIVLDDNEKTVLLKEEGARIGFGAIGKGYAANQAKLAMSKIEGVKGGLVNASGDLLAWGESGRDDGWRIQISDPTNIKRRLVG